VSPRAAAAAVARGAAATVHVPARTRTLPRRPAPPRRRSGAAAPPRVAPRGLALPRYDLVALLDRLLRGPLYIAVVGLLLAGIVFFNVDVLELNHGIASTDARAAQLKRQNAALTLQLAKLGSSERIQRVALARGLVLPQPGDVRYLRARPQDAQYAVRIMTAPDASAASPFVPAAVSQQSTPTAVSVPPAGGVSPLQAGDSGSAGTSGSAPASATSSAPTASTTAPTAAATATAAPATTAQPTP
jgi:cell division protein FtsL